MKIRKLKLLFCATLLGAFSAGFLSAEIRFKNIYQSDMVLPAGEENIVAGVTDPAASAVEVSVLAKLNDGKSLSKKIKAKVNKNGAWFAKIPAFPKRTVLEISAKNEKGETVLGDVIICLKRAEKQSEDFGHSFKRELTFLYVHSLLHLLGYDHIEDEEREIMEEKQRIIMEKLNILRD